MSTVYDEKVRNACQIEQQTEKSTDGNVRILVGPICKIIWPNKTDCHVAVVCGCDPRNARRYLNGELPIPAKLAAEVLVRLVQR